MADQKTTAGQDRKTWDKEEWKEKAKQKDEEERQRAKENEERAKKGLKPRKRPAVKDLPKPTEVMKRREGSLELEKNLNKTMVVTSVGGRGPGQPGFYCEVCSRNYKDSNSYLDHINSRAHLRMLGQTTNIERSTIEQVRAKIARLREETKEAQGAKAYDFDKRLAQIKAKEDALKAERKAKRKEIREAQRIELAKSNDIEMAEGDDMARMMGFSGFGTTKK